MKRAAVLLATLALPRCVLGRPTSTPASQGTKPLVITHVTVIDATGAPARPEQSVLVADGRIGAVAPSARLAVPPDAEVVDGTGKFLIPGLWDMHIHLTIVPGQAVSRNVIVPLLVAHGVTGVRDMGGDLGRLQDLRREIGEGTLVGPRILTPGPFVDGPQPAGPAVLPVATDDEARRAVRALKEKGVDFIKVQASLSRSAYLAVAAEAKNLGIPFAGHVPEAVSAFDVARAHQRSVEHVSPALPGDAGLFMACSGEEAELRAELAALNRASEEKDADRVKLRDRRRALQRRLVGTRSPAKCAALFAELVTNGVAAVPTQVFGRMFAPVGVDDLPSDLPLDLFPASSRKRWEGRRADYMKSATAGDFAFWRLLADRSRDLVRDMHRAGVTILAGTDAMDAWVLPGFSLHQELALLVESGFTPMEALQAATREPARFLGEEKSRGTVEKGMAADLVLLDANPLEDIRATRSVTGVVLRGRYLSKEALGKLCDDARRAAAGL